MGCNSRRGPYCEALGRRYRRCDPDFDNRLPLTAVAFSSDGRLIATAGTSGKVSIWNTGTGTPVSTFGVDAILRGIAFYPNDDRIVVVGDEPSGSVWRASSGTLVGYLEGHFDGVNAVAVSADSRKIVTVSDDNTARVWDANTLKPMMTGIALGVSAFIVLRSDGSYDVSPSVENRLMLVEGNRFLPVTELYQSAHRHSGHSSP
jgi:WD40 repeat protein